MMMNLDGETKLEGRDQYPGSDRRAVCSIDWPTDTILRSAFFSLNTFLRNSFKEQGTNALFCSKLEMSSGFG